MSDARLQSLTRAIQADPENTELAEQYRQLCRRIGFRLGKAELDGYGALRFRTDLAGLLPMAHHDRINGFVQDFVYAYQNGTGMRTKIYICVSDAIGAATFEEQLNLTVAFSNARYKRATAKFLKGVIADKERTDG